MRAKQTTEGGDRDRCGALALGGLRSSNSATAPFKEWPQRSETKRTNRSTAVRNTASIGWTINGQRFRGYGNFRFPLLQMLAMFSFTACGRAVQHSITQTRSSRHSQDVFDLRRETFVCQQVNQHKRNQSHGFSPSLDHTSTPEPVSGKMTSVTFVYMYLGLFVDIPGEGDGVVGDFLNVPDGVEALLVVSCEDNVTPQIIMCYRLQRWPQTQSRGQIGQYMTRAGSHC